MKKILCYLIALFVFGINTTYAITLTTSNATSVITGTNSGLLGYNVTFLGSLELNGPNMYALSAPFENSSLTDTGTVYLVSADELSGNITDSEISVSLSGSSINNKLGLFVIGNGDIDGDGLNDFLIISPDTNTVSIYLGRYYNNWTNNTITLTDSNLQSYSITNRYYSTLIGSINGDLNGDGIDDIVIGATGDTDGTNPYGKVYVMFGSSSILTISGTLETHADKIIFGDTSMTNFGYSVNIINDLNQDGYDELIIGNFNETTQAGSMASLFYGSIDKFNSISNNQTSFNYTVSDSLFYSKEDGSDGFSESFASLGDINQDGYGDFAIGAPRHNSNSGAVYIYYGNSSLFSNQSSTANLYSSIITKTNSYFLSLHALSGGYDVNGDAISDLIIGELTDNDNGAAYVVLGNSNLSDTIELSTDAAYIISDDTQGKLGFTVASGSDVNVDGVAELFIGSNGMSGTNGESFFYQLTTLNLITANAITVYNDDTFSTEITNSQLGQWVYIQATATDTQPTTKNLLGLSISSDSSTKNLILYCQETDINTGIFRGKFYLTGTRTNYNLSQFRSQKNSSITIESLYNDTISTSIDVNNSAPIISNISLTQIGTLANTSVYIAYYLKDLNNDTISFDQNSNQLQYSLDGLIWDDLTSWSNSELTDINLISSTDQGEYHSTQNIPIIWGALGTTNETIYVRIQAYDGTTTSDYITSNALTIDNTAPDAPVLITPNTKYSSSIILTGNSEALSSVEIYVNNSLSTTVQTNSEGIFSADNLLIPYTNSFVYAVATDYFDFSSSSSNIITITLGDLTIESTVSSNLISATIPENITDNELILSIEEPELSSLPDTSELYSTIFSFELTSTTESSIEFTKDITFNITLADELSVTTGVTVEYLDSSSNTWSDASITILTINSTTLSFSAPYLGTFLISQLDDPDLPSIGSVYINDHIIYSTQYYPSSFTITTTIEDDTEISTSSITITNDTSNTVITSNTTSYSNQDSADLSFSPSGLTDGSYTLDISVWDSSGNESTIQYFLEIDTSQLLFSILNGPNPINFNSSALIFGYDLSTAVDELSIFLIDQSGRTLWTYEASNVSGGYQTLSWDGYDKFGKLISNGIYYAYCFAKLDSTIKRERLKIAVIK